MNRMDGNLSFFDHSLTQPKVTALFIDFWQFLQLADLIHQYEEWIDQVKDFEESDLPGQLGSCLRMLHPDLPEHYPFTSKISILCPPLKTTGYWLIAVPP
ncbi:hypothetical protein GK047_28585 [Paenibacillus sp. SYP-B3998]|uniref:Uncharacterized protein n=1 Tax=Paenibacillus sp. SYP-B3998 TaxID=2678564 RepID=A0A6G4A5W5_9BACL|nr:hypothetical protein [Paenibacillus sp. SYP-B3998]NEW09863.1 hypothetical protein [Paenibacillus sp. SYP-B3998]